MRGVLHASLDKHMNEHGKKFTFIFKTNGLKVDYVRYSESSTQGGYFCVCTSDKGEGPHSVGKQIIH